LPKIFSVLYNM